MIITRVRGDNYPIEATLKVNGTAVNLAGSTVTFSYIKDGSQTSQSIAGVIISAVAGTVQFLPTVTDFIEDGKYRFDIQRLSSGIKTTHTIGELIIQNDITKT